MLPLKCYILIQFLESLNKENCHNISSKKRQHIKLGRDMSLTHQADTHQEKPRGWVAPVGGRGGDFHSLQELAGVSRGHSEGRK